MKMAGRSTSSSAGKGGDDAFALVVSEGGT